MIRKLAHASTPGKNGLPGESSGHTAVVQHSFPGLHGRKLNCEVVIGEMSGKIDEYEQKMQALIEINERLLAEADMAAQERNALQMLILETNEEMRDLRRRCQHEADMAAQERGRIEAQAQAMAHLQSHNDKLLRVIDDYKKIVNVEDDSCSEDESMQGESYSDAINTRIPEQHIGGMDETMFKLNELISDTERKLAVKSHLQESLKQSVDQLVDRLVTIEQRRGLEEVEPSQQHRHFMQPITEEGDEED